MWWLWACIGLACVAVVAREIHGLRACGVGRVSSGAHAALGESVERPDHSVAIELRAVTSASQGATRPPQRPEAASDGAAAGSAEVQEGALAGGLALGAGAVDWWQVDPAVLKAVEQWTGDSVDDRLDLWRVVRAEAYKVQTLGFEIKLRGHVAEHDIVEQLAKWAGDRVTMPGASNNPGFDLTLDDHPINVKIGQDASSIREHRTEHPDIPVLVNADMQGLPEDALRLDLSQPFDPDLLADHSVIVADGLMLSDLQDSMADAFGPGLHSFSAEDLFDSTSEVALPMLGSAVRVVRSGVRENRLRKIHGDDGRALRNIGTDVTLVAGGVAGGGFLGVGLGALIDVCSLGATAGLGVAAIGPAIGSAIGARAGGKKAADVRMRPLHMARADVTKAVTRYDRAVTEATSRAAQQWTTRVVPGAELRADGASHELKRAAATVLARAQLDLTSSARLDAADRAQVLHEASDRVDSAACRFAWYWLARRRARAWRAAMAEARDGSSASLLDVVAAAPSGDLLVRAQLSTVARRRATVMAAAGIAGARLQRLAELERARLLTDLVAERDGLQQMVQQVAQPLAESLQAKTDLVRRELVATGARSQEWVDEHFAK